MCRLIHVGAPSERTPPLDTPESYENGSLYNPEPRPGQEHGFANDCVGEFRPGSAKSPYSAEPDVWRALEGPSVQWGSDDPVDGDAVIERQHHFVQRDGEPLAVMTVGVTRHLDVQDAGLLQPIQPPVDR